MIQYEFAAYPEKFLSSSSYQCAQHFFGTLKIHFDFVVHVGRDLSQEQSAGCGYIAGFVLKPPKQANVWKVHQ
jgi:hypothetical protein